MTDFYCPYNLSPGDCRCCEDVIVYPCGFGVVPGALSPEAFAKMIVGMVRDAREAAYAKRA